MQKCQGGAGADRGELCVSDNCGTALCRDAGRGTWDTATKQQQHWLRRQARACQPWRQASCCPHFIAATSQLLSVRGSRLHKIASEAPHLIDGKERGRAAA